jgi:hypothetical protein
LELRRYFNVDIEKLAAHPLNVDPGLISRLIRVEDEPCFDLGAEQRRRLLDDRIEMEWLVQELKRHAGSWTRAEAARQLSWVDAA